jgi:hypothetical protein
MENKTAFVYFFLFKALLTKDQKEISLLILNKHSHTHTSHITQNSTIYLGWKKSPVSYRMWTGQSALPCYPDKSHDAVITALRVQEC